MDIRLDGRQALVTGCVRGIGQAIRAGQVLTEA
jgi:NAD(P)-dependent dehydrogenase (short-subunit alcohol dehydrogenase family)